MKLNAYYLTIFIFIFIILFSAVVFGQAALSPQQYKAQLDKKINASLSKIQYFVKLRGTDNPFRVPEPNYWPRDAEFNYSLFYDDNGKLVYALKEPIPQSELSAGWKLIFAYYFSADENGKTLAVHKYSTYFNNYCIGNETITLNDVSYFDKNNFKRIERNYSLSSETGRQLDSMQCEPPYHFPYHHFAPTRDAFLKENKFK